jgi:hypothetical protein
VEHLRVVLHLTLPGLSAGGRQFLDLLVAHRGTATSPRFVAAALGLGNRHQLRRMLEREGLPSYEIVSAWVRVLWWVAEWEFHKVSLCELALGSGGDPAILYRTVRRVTGLGWTEARACGTAMLALRLRAQCRQQVDVQEPHSISGRSA